MWPVAVGTKHVLRQTAECLLVLGVGVLNLLQDQYILAVFLQSHRVGLDITHDPVEVLLIHTQEVAVVLVEHYARRSAIVHFQMCYYQYFLKIYICFFYILKAMIGEEVFNKLPLRSLTLQMSV